MSLKELESKSFRMRRRYAVVFGEGVLNDVVSILLSTSVEDATTLPPMLFHSKGYFDVRISKTFSFRSN